MANEYLSTHATEGNTARFSIPTKKPYQLFIDVTPVYGEAIMPGLSALRGYKVSTGIERLDLRITVREAEDASAETTLNQMGGAGHDK